MGLRSVSWIAPSSHTSARAKKELSRLLDYFHQKQDENDEEDERDSASAVVTDAWSHAITTEAEHKNQNDQKDKHSLFLRSAKIRYMEM